MNSHFMNSNYLITFNIKFGLKDFVNIINF